MNLLELFLVAVGLSMDAFAVAACTGLTMSKATIGKSVIVGSYFGVFQAIMPLLGYFLATQFDDKIITFDHWIAFGLLGFIGGKMIIESFKEEGCSDNECSVGERFYGGEASLKLSRMLPLAIATSIDALAVGISFAFLQISVIQAVSLIGITTFVLSMAGVKIGNVCGTKFKSKAELAGGVILVLIGLKILLEHMGIIKAI